MFINNCSDKDLIIAIHDLHDKFQAFNLIKILIKSNSNSDNISNLLNNINENDNINENENKEEFLMHIHIPGLFGLISPRTKLSVGFGYQINLNYSYRIKVTENTNKFDCQVIKLNELDNNDNGINIEANIYKFGDMVLKPSLKLLGSYLFDCNVYHDYKNNQSNNNKVIKLAENITETDIWGMFFTQICESGKRNIENNIIQIDDIEMQEPYLFIGLPACSIFNMLYRSIDDSDGLILINDRKIIKSNCPKSFLSLFDLIISAKNELNKISKLQENELIWIQEFLLFSSSERNQKDNNDAITEERKNVIRKTLSHIIGISCEITQEKFFKDNFLKVLEDILIQ